MYNEYQSKGLSMSVFYVNKCIKMYNEYQSKGSMSVITNINLVKNVSQSHICQCEWFG